VSDFEQLLQWPIITCVHIALECTACPTITSKDFLLRRRRHGPIASARLRFQRQQQRLPRAEKGGRSLLHNGSAVTKMPSSDTVRSTPSTRGALSTVVDRW
jgi:hypothetical protein